MSDEVDSALGSAFRGASFFTIGRVFSQIIGFIFNLILTNYLGPVGYGLITYADTIMMATLNIADLGTDKALMRFFPDSGENNDQVLGLAGLSVVIAGFGSGLLLYVLAPVVSSYTLDTEGFVVVLRSFAFVLPFRSLTKLIYSSFRALEMPNYQLGISEGIIPISRLAAAIVSVGLGFTVEGVATAILVATTLLFIIATGLLLSKTSLRPKGGFNGKQVTDFYSYSLPLTLNSAGVFFINNIDILMVGFFSLGSAAVGQYRAAALLTTVAALPLNGLNQMFPARASRLYTKGNLEELNSLYKVVTRWAITATIPIVIGLFIFRESVLSLFGDGFVAAQAVLAVLVLRRVFDVLTGPCGYVLMMTDHQNISVLNSFGLGIMNVVLNVILIGEYGIVGAALATSSSVLTFNIIRVVEVWWFERLTPYSRSIYKPLIAAPVCLMVMISIRRYSPIYLVDDGVVTMLLGGLAGVAAFTAVVFALGIEEQDRQLLVRK
jgi:O-antigen/teichoic acid export membrane protein